MAKPSLLAKIKPTDTTGWAQRHNQAIALPKKHERPVINLLQAWELYAVEHENRFESKIGEDYFLGPYWLEIGRSIRGLLNGETGRLDCGTLDAFILDTARYNGMDIEG